MSPGALPLFTHLNNRYLIGRVLGKGGFGITYIAKDIVTDRVCAVKEYMPTEYAARDGETQNVYPFPDQKAQYVFAHGKEKYIEEAKTLLRLLNDPIVVDIWDYFTQNNTAYFVMEFLDGNDLRKRARLAGGTVDPDFAKLVFVTVASSLMEIHRMNILHRDLSPENIIITVNGQIKLIDFGAARNFVSTQNKGMSILLKPGFAPPEQYSTKGSQGPWTDVYALCATFYNVVSGKPLVDALFRYRGERQPSLSELGCAVSKKTSDVIEKGMELDHNKRYQDFRQLLDSIDIEVASKPQAMPEQQAPKPPEPPPQPQQQLRPALPQSQTPATTLMPVVTTRIPGMAPVKNAVRQGNVLTIGRSRQSSDLVMDHDTNISRIHCYVRYDERERMFFLRDISANGTYLENGMRLEKNREYPIPPGSKFYLATQNNMLAVGMEQ
jgi:serine/threonine protein kinase